MKRNEKCKKKRKNGFLLLELLVSAGVSVTLLVVLMSYIAHLYQEYEHSMAQLTIINAFYAPLQENYFNAQLSYAIHQQEVGASITKWHVTIADKHNSQNKLERSWLEYA